MTLPIIYDLVKESDLDAAIEIEHAGFPPDEAATLESFKYRQSQAPDLFLGAFLQEGESERKLIGYTCSTLSSSETLTHSSMSTHIPDSKSICIHSVCVHPSYRRQGVALNLLKAYIDRLQATKSEDGTEGWKYDRVLLISHEELVNLYLQAGFEYVGKSAVIHGSKPWFELRKVLHEVKPRPQPGPSQPIKLTDIKGKELTSIAESLPPGLLEALQHSTSPSRQRPVAKLLASFSEGISEVLATDNKDGKVYNKVDLLCPRQGCGSVILKNNVAELVERESFELEPPAEQAQNPHLPPLPASPALTKWWKITPNVMAFENVGFSKPVGGQLSPNGKKLKLLLCADCDLGPLGWCEEGGTEFWLVADRVGYRV
ncbi:Mss4-like protein [Abortiporus biennis]|nr:Mss4-like protein [Abortiporus biennis]